VSKIPIDFNSAIGKSQNGHICILTCANKKAAHTSRLPQDGTVSDLQFLAIWGHCRKRTERRIERGQEIRRKKCVKERKMPKESEEGGMNVRIRKTGKLKLSLCLDN
jgi:hypothetical protein